MPTMANPPDPHPKTPKLKAPPGAADCHHHLFGPRTRYPFPADAMYESPDALAETHMAMQDKLGLSYSVAITPAGYGADNRQLAETLARFPHRFRGIVLMPEDAPDTDYERLTALGVRGLRFSSAGHGAKLPGVSREVAARAHAYGWHVDFYPHGTDITEHASTLLAMKNPIVLDHFGGMPAEGGIGQEAFRTVLRLLDSGRVWVKLSGPMRIAREEFPYSIVTPFAHALVAHAPERLIWGSDWPHVNMNDRQMPNDGDLLDLMLDWVPDETVRNRILADNPRALFGFPKP